MCMVTESSYIRTREGPSYGDVRNGRHLQHAFVNNRAEGNAPLTVQAYSSRPSVPPLQGQPVSLAPN